MALIPGVCWTECWSDDTWVVGAWTPVAVTGITISIISSYGVHSVIYGGQVING